MMHLDTPREAVPPLSSLIGLEPGVELARYSWQPITRTQLAFYCAASGVTDPIHYDLSMAREHGFDDIVVNGSFRVGMFELLLRDLWAGQAKVEELRCRHRRGMLIGSFVHSDVRLGSVDRNSCELELTHRVDDHVTDTCSARIRTSSR